MRIIARKTLKDYGVREPAAKKELDAWFAEAKHAKWKTPAEIKAKYANASILKNQRVVFNICGNNYRLIVRINFKFEIIYIRFVGTHKEYDRINAETI